MRWSSKQCNAIRLGNKQPSVDLQCWRTLYVKQQQHTLAVRAVAIVAVLADAAVGSGKIVAVSVLMAYR